MTMMTVIEGTNPLRCECGKLTCTAVVGKTQPDKASIQAAKADARSKTSVNAPMFVIAPDCFDDEIQRNDRVLFHTERFLIVQAREDV